MVMIAAYNLYLGGFLPEVSPKNSIHNKRELKNKYKSIVSLNNANPLVMVKLSADTQAYALSVKETSMELSEAAKNVATADSSLEEDMGRLTEVFNRLLKESDEFGEKNNRPSRPGGELRLLVEQTKEELQTCGVAVGEDGFLSVDPQESLQVPQDFLTRLTNKCEEMSINPMEYVDKKVYSYAHIYNRGVGSPYHASMYSGMLFNSYC